MDVNASPNARLTLYGQGNGDYKDTTGAGNGTMTTRMSITGFKKNPDGSMSGNTTGPEYTFSAPGGLQVIKSNSINGRGAYSPKLTQARKKTWLRVAATVAKSISQCVNIGHKPLATVGSPNGISSPSASFSGAQKNHTIGQSQTSQQM